MFLEKVAGESADRGTVSCGFKDGSIEKGTAGGLDDSIAYDASAGIKANEELGWT
jgi:hypothetical protein